MTSFQTNNTGRPNPCLQISDRTEVEVRVYNCHAILRRELNPSKGSDMKPQTEYCYCLQFSFLGRDYFLTRNAITLLTLLTTEVFECLCYVITMFSCRAKYNDKVGLKLKRQWQCHSSLKISFRGRRQRRGCSFQIFISVWVALDFRYGSQSFPSTTAYLMFWPIFKVFANRKKSHLKKARDFNCKVNNQFWQRFLKCDQCLRCNQVFLDFEKETLVLSVSTCSVNRNYIKSYKTHLTLVI